MPRAEHPNKSAALRAVADGMQVSDVAKQFKVAARTLRRWRESEAKPAPTLATLEGWGQLKSEAIDELRRQSANGKTAATKELHRLASLGEAVDNECGSQHMHVDHFRHWMQRQFTGWQTRIQRHLAPELAKRYGLSEGPLVAWLTDWLDDTRTVLQRDIDET